MAAFTYQSVYFFAEVNLLNILAAVSHNAYCNIIYIDANKIMANAVAVTATNIQGINFCCVVFIPKFNILFQ
jgi:hypothetical protein